MIFAKQVNDIVELRFKSFVKEDLFKSLVDRIKSIPGRKFTGSSCWTIPVSESNKLNNLFTKKELVWEEDPLSEVVLVQRIISTDVSFLDEILIQPYPFQVIGINFLCDVRHSILADEMGLGKTIQILGSIYKLYRQGKVKRTLIICPSTLKYQWEEEIEKFINVESYNIDYMVIDGSVKERKAIYESIPDSNILYTIINYELVRNDIDSLSKIKWDVIALKSLRA